MVKRLIQTFVALVVAVLVLGLGITAVVYAQGFAGNNGPIALARGMLTGLTKAYPVPAYTNLVHFSTTQAGVYIKSTPGVLGCVTINQAGAAGSLISLYNATGAVTGYEMAIIDATKVGGTFCYPGAIFSGSLWLKITSSGAAPDVSITFK